MKNYFKIGFCTAGVVSGLTPAVYSQNKQAAHPNIVYVFPDQFRKTAMGFWEEEAFNGVLRYASDPVHTPHLNAFARESLVLTEAVSNCPLSSPHRGMLLSGMYPHRSGVTLNCNSDRPNSSLRQDISCLGDVFCRAGYSTGYIGKYHADFPVPNDPQRPGHYVDDKMPCWDAYTPPARRHGFEYWYSYGTFDVHKHPHYWDTQGNRHDPQEFSPKHEADMAVSYIKNEKGQRDANKPFLLIVSMNPPHSPYASAKDVMPEDYDLYKNIPLEKLLNRKNVDRNLQKIRNAPYYFANVTAVDREFGRILLALKEQGLDQNTIVVFTSDHGETMCSHVEDPKNSPYAESFDVPFLIRYPGKIIPRTDNILMGSPDIMPTLIGLAGLSDVLPSSVQGADYAVYFLDPERNSQLKPRSALYIRNANGEKASDGKIYDFRPDIRGLKTERYTFAVQINKSGQVVHTYFFDNFTDPYQLNNIPFEEKPEEVNLLWKELLHRLKMSGDPAYEIVELAYNKNQCKK
ncbi:MAG: sulfatase [Dysgonamonadaceae bacterium]|jgi:arylsulfatase A-like enzyme|nr:sulfatase [Dysgonamonadaceae bacterium]